MKIVVVGAGIAGLAIAARANAAHEVVVLEREPVAGGKVHSQKIDGYLFDWGPNGFLSNAAELAELAGEIGLADEMTPASPAAAKRLIYWNGSLHELPSKPQRALAMSLLSPLGKLRALADLWLPAADRHEISDESVQAFFTRRFGREVAERIVAPAVLGVSGGDAATTSVAALFPRLPAFERERGSILRAVARGRTIGKLTSFGAHGMQALTDRLAARLGDRLRTNYAVERIEPIGDSWRIHGSGSAIDADCVVVAVPSDSAAALVDGFDSTLGAHLRRIPYAPMRVAGIAFRAEDVAAPLDAFGFLAARNQGIRILGALYTSTIYPSQAPPGVVYLRVFLGGAADPEAATFDTSSARAVVRADLQRTLGITAEPIAYHDAVWPRAIPQYGLDHRALVARIDARVATHRGLSLAGNAYRGLGLSDNVRDALRVAESLMPRDVASPLPAPSSARVARQRS